MDEIMEKIEQLRKKAILLNRVTRIARLKSNSGDRMTSIETHNWLKDHGYFYNNDELALSLHDAEQLDAKYEYENKLKGEDDGSDM